MKQSIIYALDFDGVICDSAVETGISAWKAARQIWNDLETDLPSQQFMGQFRQVRPILETGYEAIIIVRLLIDGISVDEIVNNSFEMKNKVYQESNLKIDKLKKLFGETRDNWIKNDVDDWIAMNPLFPGVAEKLQDIVNQGICYIITTKQERFVKQILNANRIALPEQRIFGLDRKMSKTDVLTELLKKHPQDTIYFVEDRLPTLVTIANNSNLKAIKLFLALWGYNTAGEKLDAKDYAIELIDIDRFLRKEICS